MSRQGRNGEGKEDQIWSQPFCALQIIATSSVQCISWKWMQCTQHRAGQIIPKMSASMLKTLSPMNTGGQYTVPNQSAHIPVKECLFTFFGHMTGKSRDFN